MNHNLTYVIIAKIQDKRRVSDGDELLYRLPREVGIGTLYDQGIHFNLPKWKPLFKVRD